MKRNSQLMRAPERMQILYKFFLDRNFSELIHVRILVVSIVISTLYIITFHLLPYEFYLILRARYKFITVYFSLLCNNKWSVALIIAEKICILWVYLQFNIWHTFPLISYEYSSLRLLSKQNLATLFRRYQLFIHFSILKTKYYFF